MATTTTNINADVGRKNLRLHIRAKQGDAHSRFLRVTLCNEGEAIEIPTTDTAIINAEREDGDTNAFECTINADGTVTAPLAAWMLANTGWVRCSISIIEGNDVKLTTQTIMLDVEALEYTGEGISQDEYYSVLVDLIGDVQEALNAFADIIDPTLTTTERAADAAKTGALVADQFLTTKAYTAGQYVLYNGTLYRFIGNHAAGAWNTAHVIDVSLSADMERINSSFAGFTAVREKTLVSDDLVQGSFNINGELISSTTRIRTPALMRVYVGDVVAFTGGSTVRLGLIAKYDENGKYLEATSYVASYTLTITWNGYILPVFRRSTSDSSPLTPNQYDATWTITRETEQTQKETVEARKSAIQRWALSSTDFVQGSIASDGWLTSSNTRIRTGRFKVYEGDILLFAPGTTLNRMVYAIYDGSGTLATLVSDLIGKSYVVAPYDGYMVVALKNSSDVNVTPSDYDADVQIISKTAVDYFDTVLIDFEYGGLSTVDGYVFASKTYQSSRSKYTYKSAAGEIVSVKFDASDIASSTLRVFFYASDTTYIKYMDFTPQNNTIMFIMPSDAVYMRFVIVRETDYYNTHTADVSCSSAITKCYNLNQPRMSTYGGIGFNYTVAGKTMTSGRLRLPPNYTPDGSQKVPLIVYGHGSGGMTTWNSTLGGVGETPGEHTEEFGYLCNEGFAVFDCYPWTNKKNLATIADEIYNPVSIPVNMLSYIEGIKYVCDRYNVDINNVVLLTKSQGGNLSHWAMSQDYFHFKAIGLFAPSVGICNLKSGAIYFNANERAAITKYVPFEGTSSEISTFISTTNGKGSSAVMTFLRNNIDKVISTIPFAHGLRGAKYDDIFDGAFTGLNATPQWMLDKGVPAYNAAEAKMPAIASHDEYSRYTATPCKYWVAYDDENTSSHMAYALYTWLLNGGSDVQFRVLPNGTGKHYAMDSSPDALRTSGTTALGISYEDVALGYVEAVAFFREKMALS